MSCRQRKVKQKFKFSATGEEAKRLSSAANECKTTGLAIWRARSRLLTCVSFVLRIWNHAPGDFVHILNTCIRWYNISYTTFIKSTVKLKLFFLNNFLRSFVILVCIANKRNFLRFLIAHLRDMSRACPNTFGQVWKNYFFVMK